jgi:2-polyprenyl-3-methyl-5-hydroxy-6-metoxy-1,4-benzoquinol methylase
MTAMATEARDLVQRTTHGLHEYLFNTVFSKAPRNASVLDVGCGTGAWLARLIAGGFQPERFAAIDLDGSGFALPAVEFHEYDLNREQWPVPLQNIDFITAIEVLEHVSNVGAFLKAASRVMGDDTLLVLTSPNIASLESRLRFFATGRLPQFDHKSDPTHVIPIYHNCLARLCDFVGLEIVDRAGYTARASTDRMYSSTVRLAATLASSILPNATPGEISVWLIKKRKTA